MKIYFVDSFTTEKFKGNPAAVCIPATRLDNDTMQKIASEIGFSETAFIDHLAGNTYSIRFFTPKIEIPLCGHATLAAAKIIFDSADRKTITFINCDDVEFPIEKAGDKLKMQFPVYELEEIDVRQKLLDALGIKEILNKRYNPETKIVLLEIISAGDLANLNPDFAALLDSCTGIHGVLVTAISNTDEFDFHYRYFWPWAGTNEDPVTGGVQTFLAKYWALKLNKTKLKAYQSSLRTGSMDIELLEDRVYILGEAVTMLEGNLVV
ncbi:MAG TPA: PhzF family phenazine biosynthesis protein [Chitinophagaceae bacterium]